MSHKIHTLFRSLVISQEDTHHFSVHGEIWLRLGQQCGQALATVLELNGNASTLSE